MKEEHGGDYAEDWYAKMIATGEVGRIAARLGADDKIRMHSQGKTTVLG